MNQLFYGDCLTIMQRKLGSQCADLIYLDPPFNSKRNYNMMYKTMTGKPVPEQAEAFCDTWEMDAEKEAAITTIPLLMRQHGVDEYYAQFWDIWVKALKNTQPHLLAYLIYMVERLIYMKLVLKPTGSIYLHCDPTASHYIKVMMDGIFGHRNFKSEIIWKRTSSHGSAKRSGPPSCKRSNHMADKKVARRGRPKLSKGEALDDLIPASRCKAGERTRYEIAASTEGLSLTQWVRHTLNKAVEK